MSVCLFSICPFAYLKNHTYVDRYLCATTTQYDIHYFISVQRKHISVRLAEATSRVFSTYSPFGAMLFGFVVVHNSKLHTGGRVCNVRLSCLIVPLSAIVCIFSPCVRNISIGVMRRCF